MLSVKSVLSFKIVQALRIGLLCAVLVHPAYAGKDVCANARSVELNGTLRTYGDGGVDLFQVDVPASGLLMVQVVAPIAAPAPKVAPFGENCGLESPAVKRHILYTFATGFVLDVREQGAHRFGVAAEDPRRGLGRYKVVTGFVGDPDLTGPPANKSAGAFDTAVDDSTEDPDPEPDPVDVGSTADPDPEPDPGTDKVTGKTTGKVTGNATGRKSFCHPSSMDDHGDVFACASTLIPGTSRKGRLANSWDDDRDVFTFVLTEWQTVEVEGSGDAEPLGVLYDLLGQRLSVEDTNLDEGFRFIVTLAPGQYFVGVETANGARGNYTVSLDVVLWPSSK